jgi:hypothetical protein
MRSSTLLTISIVLNLTLVTAVGYVYKHRSVVQVTEPAAKETAKVAKLGGFRSKRKNPDASEVAGEGASKFTWRAVEAAEYKVYIANLRAIDCPEETVRDIIVADVEKLYAGKLKTLRRDADKGSNFWEEKNWRDSGVRDVWRQQRALEKEKRALLIELLGVDPQKEKNKLYGNIDYAERMYPFLTEEKRQQAQDIQEKFQDLEQDVYQKYKGYHGEETQAELKTVRDQRRAELAKILTPNELEEYELRNSQTAQQLGWDLKSFDANEQEFRSIFKVKKAFDDNLGNTWIDPDDKEAQKKYQAANAEKDKEIKAALGDSRYAEYKRSQDWEFQQLDRLANRQGLPSGSANKVYDMKQAAQDQVAKVRNDSTLTSEQRKAALKAIQVETEKAVGETLGEKGYKQYKDQSGWWIRSLSQ